MSIPTIQTSRLTLRPFEPADAPVVQRLAGDPLVAATTLNVPHPYGDGVAEAWIATHAANWEDRTALSLAVTTSTDGVIGAMGLHLKTAHCRAELGYWIGVPYWGRGYATEAASAVLDYAFQQLGLNRVEAHHFVGNPASGRVMQKVGMTMEGIRRQHVMKNGEPMDLALYSILSGDPRPPR